MSSSFLNVQGAFVSALKAALTIPVYDSVPENLPPPFCVVDSDLSTSADTKTYNGVSHSVEVHVYSAKRGKAEVHGLLDAIYAALQRQPLTVTGVTASPPQFEFKEIFREPDGTRGVMRFMVRTTP